MVYRNRHRPGRAPPQPGCAGGFNLRCRSPVRRGSEKGARSGVAQAHLGDRSWLSPTAVDRGTAADVERAERLYVQQTPGAGIAVNSGTPGARPPEYQVVGVCNRNHQRHYAPS